MTRADIHPFDEPQGATSGGKQFITIVGLARYGTTELFQTTTISREVRYYDEPREEPTLLTVKVHRASDSASASLKE